MKSCLRRPLAWLFVLLALLVPADAAFSAEPSLTVGESHVVYVDGIGLARSWGRNFFGQLGDGTYVSRSHPSSILADVVQVSAARSHTLFLKTDGSAWGAGSNANFALGNANYSGDFSTPVSIMGSVQAVSAGASHSLFLKTDGTVWATGYNPDGRLGDGGNNTRYTPVAVMTGVQAIAAGETHSLFLKNDGSVWASGANSQGQLGDGTTTTRLSPVRIMDGVRAIAAGGAHSLFLKTDGTVWATGFNNYGQLGDGTTTGRLAPVQILSEVSAIAVGRYHSLFLKTDGTAWACGYGNNGTIGSGDNAIRPTPFKVLDNVRALAGGENNSAFLLNDGSLWTTGYNTSGQIGDGATESAFRPVRISAHIISQSADLGVGPGETPTLYALGGGSTSLTYQWYRGETGDVSSPVIGAVAQTYTPAAPATVPQTLRYWVRVSNAWSSRDSATITVSATPKPAILNQTIGVRIPSGQTANLSVSLGGEPATLQWFFGEPGDTSQPVPGANALQLALTGPSVSGTYWVRATNAHGETDSAPIPVFVGESTPVAGRIHSVVIKPDRGAWSFGRNSDGQLGLGSAANVATPPSFTLGGVLSAAGGDLHSLFLKTDGTVWATGGNAFGQLGDGTTTTRLTPVQVMSGVRAIAAGNDHSLFLKTDGSVWASGRNIYYGALGDGTLVNRPTPVLVMNGVRAIAAGAFHSLFLKTDGTVWASGFNSDGQLGDGTTTNRLVPSAVPGLASVRAIAAGSASYVNNTGYSLFLLNDDSAWACGNNEDGSLGDGTLTHRYSPVRVRDRVRSVTVGHGQTLFADLDGSIWSCGRNSFGQVGDTSDRPYRYTPLCILPVISGQDTALSVGAQGIARINLYTFGFNLSYQWYEGESGDTSRPVAGATSRFFASPPLSASTRYWARVSTSWHSVDSATVVVTHTPRPTITGQPVRARLGTGQSASLAISAAGDALTYQWYAGDSGDVSNPVASATSSQLQTPALVASTRYWVRVANAHGHSDSETIVVSVGEIALSAGTAHSLFLKPDGTVWASGQNIHGKLGDGTTGQRVWPVLVMSGVQAVAAGGNHSLFLKNDGTAWASGDNFYGQLGLGASVSAQSTPALVMSDVRSIAAGSFHSLFLKNDGTVWGSGYLSDGRLGHSAFQEPELNRLYTPTQLMAGVRAIAAGGKQSLFLRTDGTAWATGRDTRFSQLPEPVLANVAAISAGENHGLFLKTDGSAWASGSNAYGQLGDGSFVDRAVRHPFSPTCAPSRPAA